MNIQPREPGAERVHLHVSKHASQQKLRTSSDYVTWTATLHPESANVEESMRLPGNPWGTVYAGWKSDMPSAVAVEVDEVQATPTSLDNNYNNTTTSNNNNYNSSTPLYIGLCSPIELFVAFMIIVLTLFGVLLCEILGLAWYVGAFIPYWLAKPLEPPNVFTGIFYSFFMIFHFSFMIADSACLLASICVAETCAVVCWVTSMLFGGVFLANYRHQYIRRTCHSIRGVFRGSSLNPPRHLFFSKPVEKNTSPQTEMVSQPAMVEVDDVTDIP